MPRHANKQAQSPLGHWLLDYVAKNQLSLTELSRLAGLSDGTLRSLIYYPDRLPSLETCVRLAKATGYPASSFLQLAGVVETPGADTSTRSGLTCCACTTGSDRTCSACW